MSGSFQLSIIHYAQKGLGYRAFAEEERWLHINRINCTTIFELKIQEINTLTKLTPGHPQTQEF